MYLFERQDGERDHLAKNSEESFDGLDSGEGAPVRSARVIIEELAQ